MQTYIAGFASLFFTSFLSGQEIHAVRYKNLVFAEVGIQKNISYSPAEHPGIKEKHYRFDLYEPKTDALQKRPLIIWLHGGGFKFGSKNARGIKLWSKTFAQRGYVCAALNYRISKKNPLFNFTELKASCYNAVQDLQEAIAFFKKNHAKFGIDTTRIIVGGNSAGGMIALQAAYSSAAELGARALLPGAENLSNQHNPANIAAVINFWGGIFNINWLQNARVPIFSAYGTEDKIVPVNSKDTSLYGSIAIRQKANEWHVPNAIRVFDGYSHELQKHFNPVFAPSAATRQRWLEGGQSAADFLHQQLF